METHNRPKGTKQLPKGPQTQNGESPVNLGSSPTPKLHHKPGLTRCILSGANPQGLQEIPEIPIQRTGLSVPGSPLRTIISPLAVHPGDGRGENNRPSQRDPVVPLSGRLASPDAYICSRGRPGKVPGRSVPRPRSDPELQKIRASSQSELRFHRGPLQSAALPSVPKGGKLSEVSGENQKFPLLSLAHCRNVAITVGTSCGTVPVRPLRETVPQANPVALTRKLGSARGRSSRSSSNLPSNSSLPTVVDLTAHSPSRSSPGPSTHHSDYIHRCVREGLGGSCRATGIPGHLVRGGISPSHKHLGNEGCEASPSDSQSSSSDQHVDSHRQLHSKVLYQQAGRNQVLLHDAGDRPPLQPDHSKTVECEGQTHSREAQCAGGQTVKSRSGPTDRVESEPVCSGPDLPEVGSPHDRSLRDLPQLQVPPLCVPSSGPQSLGSGCSVSGLSGTRGLCLSPTASTSKDPPEIPTGVSVQTPDSGPLVAKTAVVSHTDPAGSSTSHETASIQNPSQTTRHLRNIPPQPTDDGSSRLAAGKVALIAQGHEEAVADRMLRPQSKSSIRVYDAKWQQWLKWCESKNKQPHNPSLPDISSFLLDLFNQGLAVSTLMGYRAVLSSALKFHSELDISHSPELSALMESFKQERPPASNLVPKWNLDVVLWTLMDKPFEPIHDEKTCPLLFLTWKTAFLLLLASGLRRGELHAIPLKGVSYPKDHSHITLRPDPGFISKTRIRTGHALQPVVIKSLRPLVGKEKDRTLCPTRCLLTYMKRSESVRGEKKFLFVSPDARGSREISVNTISSWISNLIAYCYRQPGQTAIDLSGKTTHELRAYASSLVHKGCWALEDILQAGCWQSNQVFVNHYLRDLSEQEGALKRLGPLVAGKQVVNS